MVDKVKSLAQQVRDARLPPPARRRRIREAAGVTLREIGNEVGVAAMTVMRWEQGHRMTRAHAIAYRRVLDALEEAISE